MIEELVHLLEKVPATFWGVIFGSFFALAGVVLTNLAQDKRLRLQFDHERSVKNQDREQTIRKDVYLAVAEAIAEALNSIMRMTDLQVPNNKVGERYMEKSTSMAKIHVVAREATARAMMLFATEMAAAQLRLFAARAPLLSLQNDIAIQSAAIDRHGTERDRWLEEMRRINLENLEPRRWQFVQQSYEFEANNVSRLLEERGASWSELNRRQADYVRLCMAEHERLLPMVLPIIVNVRQELGLPIDQEQYRQMFVEGQERQRQALTAFLEQMAAMNAGETQEEA